MAMIEKVVISAAVVLMTWASLTSARSIEVDEDSGIRLQNEIDQFDKLYQKFSQFFIVPTVGHFATHTLCKHHKKEFENAMAKKLQTMSKQFAANFVDSLCVKKPHSMLKLWASELFDTNSDGHIDNNEKYQFINKNRSG